MKEEKKSSNGFSQIVVGIDKVEAPLSLTPPVVLNRPIRPKSPNLPCIVCFKHESGHFTKCAHTTYCLSCAQQILLSSLPDNIPKCGIVSCLAEMDEGESSLYSQFSEITKSKWEGASSSLVIKQKSGKGIMIRHCQYPDCTGGVDPQTQLCSYCKGKHCTMCHRIEHPGECLDKSRLPENVKQCRFCNGRLYKEGGCSRVTCACGRQLCFECLEEWSTSHHGCAPGGWIKLPWYYLVETCCSNSNVDQLDWSQRT